MKFRTGAGLGEGGVAIDHKKFLCTQKYIFKKTRSKPMNRRKKNNEMIKNNPFFKIIVRTFNTLLFNILINKRIVKNNINRAVEINIVV